MKNKINKIRKTKFKSKDISKRILELRIHEFIDNLPGEGIRSFSLIFDSNWLYKEQSLRGKGEQAPDSENETCSSFLV
jgi:hypothetical protein